MRCRTGGSIRNRNTAGTCNSYRLSAKTHKPIASVAALTAQPLAALPPYGCGVPLAGSDRLVQSHSTAGGHWCTAALPDVSLRGAKRRGNLAVHSWITGRPRRKRNCLPEIAPQGHFLALRAQGATSAVPPRNDTSGGPVVHQRPPAVEFPCAGRSLSAATPHTSAFPILTIACANRQCPMGRRGRRPLQRPTGSLVLTFHFPFPAFSLFS